MTTENWCEIHREPADSCVVCDILRNDSLKRQQIIDVAKQEEFSKRMSLVSIGSRYRNKRWEDYNPVCVEAVTALGMVRAYANAFDEYRTNGTTLFLLGNPGTGKNFLAACLCKDVVSQGHTALHTTAAKLVRRIRESWRKEGDGEFSALATFTEPDLLVIDEVGMQKGTDDEAIRLFDVINERYENEQPVVIISNLNVKDLGKFLTVRTMERLLEQNVIVPFTWNSYRRISKASDIS
jgi:DNA replication protein DnaC